MRVKNRLSKIATLTAEIQTVSGSKGRKGKGAIYVWAVGNGGKKFDNCNADGYASSIFTIATGALTDEGLSAYYSETCASVLASTYVGGSHRPPTRETFKRDRRKIKVVVPAAHGKCLESFQGTSAAAPMAAGIIALVLQSNPNLTWRDVQQIIVQTARVPVADEEG
ncbi:PC3-like endoprotease variant B [Tachypleus tridentatus]|uniref:PC3-like endoprotease variant B n=1 Tax=Tachypleus tridentatus TaxID=6853 RepID=UPI003FD4CEAA